MFHKITLLYNCRRANLWGFIISDVQLFHMASCFLNYFIIITTHFILLHFPWIDKIWAKSERTNLYVSENFKQFSSIHEHKCQMRNQMRYQNKGKNLQWYGQHLCLYFYLQVGFLSVFCVSCITEKKCRSRMKGEKKSTWHQQQQSEVIVIFKVSNYKKHCAIR